MILKPHKTMFSPRFSLKTTASSSAENPGPRCWTRKATFIEGRGSRNSRGRGSVDELCGCKLLLLQYVYIHVICVIYIYYHIYI